MITPSNSCMDEVTILKGSILRELGWCDTHYYGCGVEGTLDKLPLRGEGGSSLENTYCEVYIKAWKKSLTT